LKIVTKIQKPYFVYPQVRTVADRVLSVTARIQRSIKCENLLQILNAGKKARSANRFGTGTKSVELKTKSKRRPVTEINTTVREINTKRATSPDDG